MIPSAPSTPQQQKRALKVNLKERSGAYTATAGTGRPSFNSESAADESRPLTHDGRMNPSSPDRASKRQYSFLSPRQISFKLEPDLEQQHTARSDSSMASRSSPPHAARKVQKQPPPITIGELDSMEKIKEEFSNAETVTEATASRWPKVTFDGTFAKFAKKAEPEITQSSKRSRIESVALPANPTAYPSLSHRLNVAQMNTPSAPAAVRFTPTLPVPRAVKDTQQQLRRKNAVDVNQSRHAMHLTLAAPTRMEVYNSALQEQHSDMRLVAGEDCTTSHIAHDLQSSSQYSEQFNNNMEIDDISAASTAFLEMELDEALDYLLASRQPHSTNASFVHVTPRHNVEKTRQENFYDLVILEKPGNPQSDLVWIPRYKNNLNLQQHVLPAMQVYQLSLHGVLVPREGEVCGELISLRDFMLQRSQVEFLRTGRFFGCFTELKAFTAWKNHARSRVVSRMRRKLMKETFFSDVELVNCVMSTNAVAFDLCSNIHLFAYHGQGSICITDYIELQVQHIHTMQQSIVEKINALTEFMTAQYQLFMHSTKLQDQKNDVMLHHPFHHMFAADNVHPDLYTLRSITRMQHEFKVKLTKLFLMAQLKLDVSVCQLVRQYWLHFKQFVLGVRQVKRNKHKNIEHYWSVDSTLFDRHGSLQYHVLDDYNTVHLFDHLDALASAAHEATIAASMSMKYSNQSVSVKTTTTATTTTNTATTNDTSALAEQGTEDMESLDAALKYGFVRTIRAYDDNGIKIPPDFEERGSHLCVDVNLCINNKPLELGDLMTLASIESIKVAIFPLKSGLNDEMHGLIGSLGDLIAAIPNLRKHPLIYDPRIFAPAEVIDPELELGDLHHSRSSAYFTYMAVMPVYNSTHGHEMVVDAIRLLQQAYFEACRVDSFLHRLFEIVRKLWALAPSSLAKQTERSLVLNKIREYINTPNSIEDLHRSQLRDLSRIKAFQLAADYLTRVVATIESFENIKHKSGLVSSFKPILQQIRYYRSIQSYLLYTRLPVSFNTRCSVFYEFIRKFEFSIETQTVGFDALILLLHRLQNFDNIRDIFDGEYDICDNMFRIIDTFNTVPKSALDNTIRALFDAKARTGGAPGLSSEKLHSLFGESKERLNICINRAKSLILGELGTIKNDTMSRRNGLHARILQETQKLAEFQFIGPKVSGTHVTSVLEASGANVFELRKRVDYTVDAQCILLEAHEIVGAANPVLKSNEVDRFHDMQELENVYTTRVKAWSCIADTALIRQQLLHSKLNSSRIAAWAQQFEQVNQTYRYLLTHITDQTDVLTQILVQINDLKPKVELGSYLSSHTLRPRHWKYMAEKVFLACNMQLKFSGRNNEFINVVDIGGKEMVGLGNINRLNISELVDRRLESQLERIRSITGEALIEQCMESTLDSVESSMQTFCVMVSPDWLKDSRLREKIFLELNEVVNITQLSVMVRYCMKSLLIVESTSQDMCLSTFDVRVDRLKVQVQRLEKFIIQLGEAQRMWYYLLHFVKFSNRGEMDRDSVRLYNNCTEDLKKIEMALQQRSDSLLGAFSADAGAANGANNANSNTSGGSGGGGANDLNTDGLKSSLSIILDDAHSSVQSLLDACPRLSLLSYNRVVTLVKTWMLGPQIALDYVSECFHALFEGVGTLTMAMHRVQRLYMCTGFVSCDKVETFVFVEQIPFNLSLDEFVRRFNSEMRMALAHASDSIMLHRINCLQALLTDTPVHAVISHAAHLFQQRVSQLTSLFSDSVLNLAFFIMNGVFISEDIWTALGHPTGAIVISRDDLALEQAAFMRVWRTSLLSLQKECNENVLYFQTCLTQDRSFPRIKKEKTRALISSLLLLEVSYLRVVEELLNCKSLESATELWAGRYQLRFQYNKKERYNYSPVEISLGSINIPYGMEYAGGNVRVVMDLELESALQKVLSSAFSMRGSVFISYDNQHSMFEAPGEYSVSCADIAAALGRIGTTLASVTDKHAVHFYLARLVYLDAVGSVDFTNINHAGLQVLITALNNFWSAIENKNDQFMQDALKFPLKNKFSRNDLQGERRKQNLSELRLNINTLKNGNRYLGPVVIGMASETFYSNVSVFDHFYRSIFNAISLPNNQPINNLGLLLTAEGFSFGMDMQNTLKTAILSLSDGKNEDNIRAQDLILQRLCTSFEIRSLVSNAAVALRLYQLSRVLIPPGKVGRFKVEMQCFCSVLWERVLRFAFEVSIDLVSLRNDLFVAFYKKLEQVSSPEEIILFDTEIGPNDLSITDNLNLALIKASHHSGLVCNHEYVAKCALLYNLVTSPSTSVMIVSGEAAVGKTAMRNTVISAIRAVGMQYDAFFSDSWPVKCRRSAQVILYRLREWYISVLYRRAEAARRREEALLSGEEPNADRYETSSQQYESAEGSSATTRHNSVVHSPRSDSPLLPSESAPRRVSFQFAHSASPGTEVGTGAGASGGGDTQLSGGHSSGSSGTSSPGGTGSVLYSNSSVPNPEASTAPSAMRSTPKEPHLRHHSHHHHHHDKQPVQTSIIYHASLSAMHLLGHYDSGGRWMDGILLRKIRCIDEKKKKQQAANAAKNKHTPDPVHVIVLNGPIGYYIEQIFSGPIYFTTSSAAPGGLSNCKKLLFPNAELHNLSADVKVIIETNDILNASPSFFVTAPMLTVTTNSSICVQRLLTLWVRSLIHWLGDFSPWLDTMDCIANLLLKKDFVQSLLAISSDEKTGSVVVVVSKISAFLRLLEDLLSQVHQMALVDATFAIPEDKEDTDSSDSDNDVSSVEDEDGFNDVNASHLKTALQHNISLPVSFTSNTTLLKGAMTMPPKAREMLTLRAKLSIVYAALWGLGGTSNSTEHRKQFDITLRDTVERCFGIDDELPITSECSLFECVLDLPQACIKQAVELDPLTLTKLTNPGIPKKFESLELYASLVADMSEKSAFGAQDRLIFRTPSTRALEAALRRLISTGANVVLFGDKGCGKSMLIADILADLKSKLSSPQQMRAQVSDNLVDIVNGARKAEGIFAVMEILKYIMGKFASTELRDDSRAEFHQMWNSAGEGLKLLWSENAKKNCTDKTVSSAVTSLRGTNGASDLRAWIEREFTTETRTVLETPRFSYGIAFVDDLHFCAAQYDKQDMRLLENRSEALLKGLTDGTPLFNIKRNTAMRSTVYYGLHAGSYDAAFDRNTRQMPILHQEIASDLRMQAVHLSDDFVLQRLGIISAATGQFNDLVHSSCFTQVLPHFCALGMPAMNLNEYHTALIAGATVCMHAGTADKSMVDVFRNEILELARFTMNMCTKMIAHNDTVLTCPIERAARSLVIIDVSLVSRFCASLRFGCSNVTNPGGLLQLFAHEWKRYFLDPLPDGFQRDRIVYLLNEQLDSIDEKKWSISIDWLKVLQEDFAAHKDRVWTDSRVFELLGKPVSSAAPALTMLHTMPSGITEVDEGTLSGPPTMRAQQNSSNNLDSRPSLLINTHFFASDSNLTPSERNTPSNNPASAITSAASIRAPFSPAPSGHIITDTITESETEVEGQDSSASHQFDRLYLPVELDRAGTERSLYSGTWDHTKREYRPIQTVEEIAQGEISKTLDFTHLVGAGDVRKVLYPAAISLILRMVRILSVANKHVLLAGYYGTTRLTALHLAAKICDLEPISFDVKQAPGVVEASPSESAHYSADFVRFLKGVVYKAAGFRLKSLLDMDDAPLLLSGELSNPVPFEIVPSQRLLVVIQSCQQLTDKDRVTLLNLIDYEDPGYLFSDNEILGMAEALRILEKERLQQNHLFSEAVAADEAAFTLTLPGTNGGHFGLMSLSLDSHDFVSSKVLPTSPPGSSRKNSTASRSRGASVDISLSGRSRTSSMDHASILHTDPGADEHGDNAAGGNNAHRLKPVFTGYAFHYVKQYLKQAVRNHLSLVIDVDLPRPMKLDTSGASVDAAAILKKMSCQQHVNADQQQQQGLSSGQSGKESRSPRKESTVSVVTTEVSAGGRLRQVSVRQRYSLLSNRKQSLLNGKNASGSVEMSTTTSSQDKLLYSPNQVNSVQQQADLEQAQSDPTQSSSSAARTTTSTSSSTSSTAEAHGIFTCSILGPMVSRRFYMLWYDIDGVDASRGICTMLMKNERRAHRVFRANLDPSHEFGFKFHPQQVYSPLTLSLRTSQIGVYIAEPGSSAVENALSVRDKLGLPRAEKDREDSEIQRRKKFKSTTVLNRYNLLLKADVNYNALALDQLGLLSHVGVFKSFRTDTLLESSREEQVDHNIASFIDEARAILPHVLSVNIVADAVFLTAPVICPGPEVTAELASLIVMNLLQVGSRSILRRKIILETALETYHEALHALEHASEAEEKLVHLNEDLQAAMRRNNKELDACRKEIEAVPRTIERTRTYEVECMLKEDVLSRRQEVSDIESDVESLLYPVRRRIFSYTAAEWTTFAMPFSSRPTKPYLELMRAIMIAIRFTPPKNVKGGGGGGGRMDDDTVARCATALLNKSADFASQLCSVAPASLPKPHLQALRMLNQLLNSTIAAQLNSEQQTPHARLRFMTERCAEDQTPPNNIYETIKKYLLLVDVAASMADYTAEVNESVVVYTSHVKSAMEENAEAKRQLSAALKARFDGYMGQMHTIDATLVKNRQKMEVIERNNLQQVNIVKAIQQSCDFANAELKQVKDVLRYLVTDVCVAAAVLLRAGWLPEQVRQESMEQIRQNLIKHEVRVRDTPFVLGQLSDRLQMRQWTAQNENSLPRDPASINTMALAHLVPFYTLIVDPDGTAPAVLLADPLEGYDKFTITAQKFTLATFQTWVAAVSENPSPAMSIIITDLQAGASDDLICFLSCDFLDESVLVDKHGSNPFAPSFALTSPTGRMRRTDHAQRAFADGISLVLNPSLDFLGECRAHAEQLAHSGESPRHTATNTNNGNNSNSARRVIHLPCKMRLYLVTAKAPCMDSYGVSRPLPTSCLKHITILHWAVSSVSSHYVEAKPSATATEKTYVSDQALSHRMGAQICKRISPLHFQYNAMVNSMLVSDTLHLYKLEDELVTKVYEWKIAERSASSAEEDHPSHVGVNTDSSIIATSLLNDARTLFTVLEAVEARRAYHIDIEMNKSLQRELITYLSTITETCSMAVDFVRMCTSLLPAESFTPHCLTSQAIGSVFLQNVLDIADKKNFLNGMPRTLAEMLRVSKAIAKVQRRIRARTLASPNASRKTKAPKPPLVSTVSGLKRAERSKRILSMRRQSTVQKIASNEVSQKRFGLLQYSREQAASDLSCLLLPLRTFILREMVNYVQLSIRPGLEWLGKFMLVLTTWSQSEFALPMEEIRTLMHFVMQSSEQISPRFSHFVSFNGVEKGDLAKDLQNLARYARESTLGFRRSRSGGSSRSRSVSADIPITAYSPQTSRKIMYEDNSSESNSVRRSRAPSIAEMPSEDDAELGEDYDEFIADLPSAGTMQNRITAFRVNEQTKPRNSVRFTGEDEALVPSVDPAESPTKSLSTTQAATTTHAGVTWMERGAGLLDGIWLNKRSTRWRLNPLAEKFFRADNTSSKMLRGRYVMLDIPQTHFSMKNTLFRPTARQGDPFEAEWLKIKGVRLFSTASASAAMALGASAHTIEEMTTAHKSALLPVFKVASYGIAAGSTASGRETVRKGSASGARVGESFRKGSAPSAFNYSAKHRESKVARKSSRKSVSKGGSAKIPEISSTSRSREPSVYSAGKANFTSKHRRLSLSADNVPDLHHGASSSNDAEDSTDEGKATGTSTLSTQSASAVNLISPANVGMNIAARTLNSGRVSIQLSSMASGLGEHRATLVFTDPKSATGQGRASIRDAAGGAKSARNSISELSQRKASVIESKRRASQAGSPGGQVHNLQSLRLQHYATDDDDEEGEELSDLLTSPQAYQNMMMLESHSSLAPIFKGMASGIVRNFNDFADWKAALFALTAVDPTKLSSKDLEVLMFTVKPPIFDDFEDNDEQRPIDEGLWLKGYELTMIQSLLLSEALVPGSCGSLVEVMYALIADYLKKDGHIAQHPDEVAGEELSDSDDDDFDEQEEDDEDHFDMHSNSLSRHASNVRASIFSASRHGSDSSMHSDAARSTFFRGLENFRKMSRVSFQEGVPLINSWSRMEKVLNGTSKERGARYVRLTDVAESTLTCRDFENWESVLLEVLTEDLGMEKFVFMKELRDSTLGSKSSVFLASHLHTSQMAVFSQRARDLAVHNYDNISVINCAAPLHEEVNHKQHRTRLMETVRGIKSAVATQRAKKAIVEMLDLQSPYGNSIISSVLLHAGHASGGAAQKAQDATQQLDMSALGAHFAVTKRKVTTEDPNADKGALAAAAAYGRNEKPWYWTFPLIMSSQWGANVPGCGPFMTLADLNYTWLPRFFSPDVINADADARETLFTKFQGLPPSLSESCGILCEELETSLLWVMNSNKSLAKSHLTQEIRQRLRKATRIEIRVTAALVTIWQLVQYVRCARREESEMPAVWSACLNPISLWQLTRLMLKASDILANDWDGMSITTIIQNPRYAKAMWLLAEGFSNTECDIYNFSHLFGSSPGTSRAEGGGRQSILKNRNTLSRNPPNASDGATPIPSGPAFAQASGSSNTNTNNNHGRRSTYIMQLKSSTPAAAVVAGAGTSNAAETAMRRLTHRAGAGQPPIPSNKTVAAAVRTDTSNNSVPEPSKPAAVKDDANLSLRAKKLQRRAQKHLEEVRLQYVLTLCSFDKFSLKNARAEAAPAQDSRYAPLDGVGNPSGGFFPRPPTDPKSAAAKKTEALEKEFMNRFLSLVGIYFAQVLMEARHVNGGATVQASEPFSLNNLASRTLEARRQSNKINIRSFLDKDSIRPPDSDKTVWPEISEDIDLTFGSLSAHDLITCLVKWTFNGGEAVGKNKWGKLNKQKIMASVKKLSQLIKEGKVTL